MKELALINLPYYQPGDSKQMDYLFEGTEPRTRTKMNNLRNHFPSIASRLSRIKGNSITVNMEDEGYRLVVFENILRISKACRPNVRFIYLHPHNPEVTLACELANWLTFELGDWYSWQTSLRSTTFLQAMNYSFATVQPFSGTEISGNSYFFMKLAVNVNVRIALANRRPWWSEAPRISVTMLGQWVASSGTAVATTLLLTLSRLEESLAIIAEEGVWEHLFERFRNAWELCGLWGDAESTRAWMRLGRYAAVYSFGDEVGPMEYEECAKDPVTYPWFGSRGIAKLHGPSKDLLQVSLLIFTYPPSLYEHASRTNLWPVTIAYLGADCKCADQPSYRQGSDSGWACCQDRRLVGTFAEGES